MPEGHYGYGIGDQSERHYGYGAEDQSESGIQAREGCENQGADGGKRWGGRQ